MRIEQQLLVDCLHELLVEGERVSEFELFQRLKQPPWEIFPRETFHDNLALFQYHFVLFHCLYRLQEHWLKDASGYLKISALHIQKQPVNGVNLEDEAESKIREYYLNWQNFQDTDAQGVEDLLDSFWDKFGSVKFWHAPAEKDVDAAMQHFALTADSNWKTVKKAWLKAQALHHPDKGGDAEVAKLNARHFDVLKRYFKFKE